MNEENEDLFGYIRISKSDTTKNLDAQRKKLLKMGLDKGRIYQDIASGREERPGMEECLRQLYHGSILVVCKLERVANSLSKLFDLIMVLKKKGSGLKVLSGVGKNIDTTTHTGLMLFNIFSSVYEFETHLIKEREDARRFLAVSNTTRGGRPKKMTKTSLRMAMQAMQDKAIGPRDIALSLGMTTTTLYDYVNGDGTLKEKGKILLNHDTVLFERLEGIVDDIKDARDTNDES